MKNIILVVTVVLGGLFVLFWFTAPTTEEAAKNNLPSASSNDVGESSLFDEEPVDVDNKERLIIGDPSAPVTLVEYGDFKCPSCNAFHHGAGAQIRDEYVSTGQVNIEFRNFPFIGPDSGRAARGSYCAQDQGAFTAYHDVIYEYLWDTHYASGDYAKEFDDIYTTDKIIEVAGSVVSDPEKLRSCIDSTDQDEHIDADIVLASQDGVSGTPGFVINGQPLNGPSNFQTFKVLLDAQLQ